MESRNVLAVQSAKISLFERKDCINLTSCGGVEDCVYKLTRTT